MTALELLQRARGAGLTARLQGDKLIVRGPKAAADLARQLLDVKAEIVALLAGPVHPPIRRGECGAGVTPCGAPARLYPCGWRCDQHAPSPQTLQGARP